MNKCSEITSCRYDLFPYTVGVDMFPCCVDIHRIVSTHVETVCLLTSVKGQPHIDFTLDIEELSKTPRTSATYPEIKAYVLEKYGLKVAGCKTYHIEVSKTFSVERIPLGRAYCAVGEQNN